MKKNTYKSTVRRILCLAMLPLMAGCLYEHPGLTADGEQGVDPTSVMLNANISLILRMPAFEAGGIPLGRPEAGSPPAYRHRFIIDTYEDRVFAARHVVYDDIVDARKEITLPVNMKLYARNYEVAVWSDYVQAPDEANNIAGTDDYFYNTAAGHLLTVYGSNTYRGNNEYKDAFCGTAELNLKEYRDQWNARVNLDITLQRPVARMQLTANDVDAFLKRMADGTVSGDSFVARLRYSNYLNMGYNVLERLPRHGLMYLQCERTFKKADLVAGQSLPLMFDYVFAADRENTAIPVALEILDSKKTTVLAATAFNVNCKAGHHTTITYGFLTADADGGVNINPDFDGKGDINVPALPEDL